MKSTEKTYPHPEAEVELKINGMEIDLNPFVKQIIYHTVIGMVKPLKGVGTVRELSLRLSKEGETDGNDK